MGLEQIPLWAQLGLASLVVFVLIVGAGTKRFGRIWVFGWVYDAMVKDRDEWKALALRALGNTERVASAAEKHTVLSPEAAEQAWRVLVETGRLPSGDDS